MLDQPQRFIQFNVPSTTEAYGVYCSFCNHRSYGKPQEIPQDDIGKWTAHVCDYKCNGFTCLRRFLKTDGKEFFVADEKYLMCYKCKQLEGSEHYKLRPFFKLPRNAELKERSGDHGQNKTTHWYKTTYPYQFEKNISNT